MTSLRTITEEQLDIMHLIQEDGESSQREIAKKIGFSLGKVNKLLIETLILSCSN